MAGSISGLASGLDTATIINQLMQLEATPRTRLQSRVGTQERQVTALQTLNAKLASLATKAEAAADPATWGRWTTTSTSDRVTATASMGATPGSFTVTVQQTALSHQLGFATTAAPTDVVLTGSTQVRLDRLDGTAATLETGDGTLQGLADALNDPANATGLRASLVAAADGTRQLLVESTTTGSASDFALTNTDGTVILGGATVRAGRDARLDLGAGVVATSTTNTFTDLMPGVSLTFAAGTTTGTVADVTVARDQAAATTLAKELVADLNAVLGEMQTLTAYGSGGTGKGLLAGDATIRSLQGQLQSTIFGDATSLATLGIELDRFGTFTFDEATFTEAYAADAEGVSTTLSSGFATRVQDVAARASDSRDGLLTVAVTGRRSGIERLNDSIESWDVRLELRRTALTRQFTALETALSQMNSQSTWLAGQISSLPTMSG